MASDFKIFIQARMGSTRFPGKVLAPLAGEPIISHLIRRLSSVMSHENVVVLTSSNKQDDPLAAYVRNYTEVSLFRGSERNVLGRFQEASYEFPSKWVVRISGDSPLIDRGLVCKILKYTSDKFDFVSNTVGRTFPSGQSVECIQSIKLNSINSTMLSEYDREHVTPFFYRDENTRICKLVSHDPMLGHQSLTIDTPDDLIKINNLMQSGSFRLPDYDTFVTMMKQ